MKNRMWVTGATSVALIATLISPSAASPVEAGKHKDIDTVDAVAPENVHTWKSGANKAKTYKLTKSKDEVYAYENLSKAGEEVVIDLPLDGDEPISVGKNGKSFSVGLPVGYDDPKVTVDGEGSVVYEAGDTSSVVANVSDDAAVSLNVVIDTAEAPERYVFPLDVPTGGEAILTDGGTVVIEDSGGNAVGFIGAPWAKDATGREIPTSYALEGNNLVQTVGHKAEPVTYPVVADPYMGVNLLTGVWRRTSGDYPRGGYSIGAHLSSMGRSVDAYVIDVYGWSELVARKPSTAAITSGMRSQWACHAGLFGQVIVWDSWDVESWRPANSNYWTWVSNRCNW